MLRNCAINYYILRSLQASLVREVKCNLQDLVEEWQSFQRELQSDTYPPASSVPIDKGDQHQVCRCDRRVACE